MNFKFLFALAFVVGCACAVPLEEESMDNTMLISDSLMPAEDNSKKPSRRDEKGDAEKMNVTSSHVPAKNESVPLPAGDHHVGDKHDKVRAAPEEMKMNHTMMPMEHHHHHLMTVSMSSSSTVTEAKNDTHQGMIDKPLNATSETAIKKRAIASLMDKIKKKEGTAMMKEDKDLLPEPEGLVPETTAAAHHIGDHKMNETNIPVQNDTALMETILKHGLLNETHSNITKPEDLKKIAMRDAGNATVVLSNSTLPLNKTAHEEHKKEHTRNAEGEECDDATHGEKVILLTERDTKPADNATASKNETLTVKNSAKMSLRRRRDAYESSAPSQIRLSVRNRPAVRSGYGARAPPPAAAPAESSYEAPDAPPAKSSYEVPPPARSSYKAKVPAAAPAAKAPSYETSAAAPAESSYEAPDAPPAKSSYEVPPPARSSYKAAAPAAKARSSYEAPDAPPSYEVPPPARSSYKAAAPAAKARSSYEAPARTAVRSSYSAPARAPLRASYAPPAAPARSSSDDSGY